MACSDKKIGGVYYKYASLESDSIILFDNSNVQLLKENLYICDDTLYLGVDFFEDKLNEKSNAIKSKKKGILLFNTIHYHLSIDTSSYTFLIKDWIAMDFNQVIAFPKGNTKLPAFEVLKLNPKKLIPLAHKNTYLKDDRFVYCVPTNTYINVEPKDFETEIRNGVIFGKIGKQYYYLDELISLDSFFQNGS